MSELWHSTKRLQREPGFACAITLILALAVGVVSAVFGVIDAVLLKPLPVQAPEELVLARWRSGASPAISYLTGEFSQAPDGITGAAFSYETFRALSQNQQTLTSIFGAAAAPGMSIVVEGHAERGNAHWVSGTFFSGLGVAPRLGRILTTVDDDPGAEPTAVIGFEYWQRRFGGRVDVLGDRLIVDGTGVTIVGVAPREFSGTLQFGSEPDIYLPLALEARLKPGSPLSGSSGAWWIQTMGRLKPGVTLAQAQADLARILAASLDRNMSSNNSRNVPNLFLERGDQGYTRRRAELKQPLLALLGISGLTLAMACGSAAALMLSRAHRRRREWGIRIALGADAACLTRQLLKEALVLAVLTGAIGFVIARWSADFIAGFLLYPEAAEVALDIRALLFAMGCSFLAVAVAAVAPSVHLLKANVSAVLKGQARSGQRERSRIREGVVVAQISIVFALLVGATSLARTVRALMNTDVRFDEQHVLLCKIDPTLAGSGVQQRLTLAQITAALGALPGVEGVAVSRHHAIGDNTTKVKATITVPTGVTGDETVHANWIGGDYFQVMDIALRRGRTLSDRDDGTKAIVVNEAFVRTFLSWETALGALVSGSEIVGVVADTKFGSMREPPPPMIYFPLGKSSNGPAALALKGSALDIAAVRRVVAQVNPLLPAYEFLNYNEQRARSIGRDRLMGRLVSLLAVLGTTLALSGVAAQIAYSVRSRLREFGIRIALGAQKWNILRLVFREVGAVVLLGTAGGAVLAVGLMRALRSSLYGIPPNDPLTFLLVGVGLAVAVVIAAWVPARYATKMDPVIALRAE